MITQAVTKQNKIIGNIAIFNMAYRGTSFSFIVGCLIGALFTIVLYGIGIEHPRHIFHIQNTQIFDPVEPTYDKANPTIPPVQNKKPNGPIIFNDLDLIYNQPGDGIAKTLAKSIRILCWVLTQPSNLKTKGKAVKDTWGKRCNVLIFMSSVEDTELPAVGLNISEGRKNLWLKTRAAWKYVFENHFNDADWFIKADDDTFIIVENLRYFVSQYSTSDPYYFGRHFVPYGGYNSGGAGYVFSKATLSSFVNVMKDSLKCPAESSEEDAEVGVCLNKVDIHPSDTRDKLGRETFHPFNSENSLIPEYNGNDFWIHKYDRYKEKIGHDCCSDHSISFHYIDQYKMYDLEYMIYHFHPFGLRNMCES